MSSTKVRSGVLGFVLLALLGVWTPRVASAQPCNVSLPAGLVTSAGADFVVPIVVTDATGALGMDFRFTYDATRFVATSVYKSSLTQNFTLVSNVTEPGRVLAVLYGPTPLSGGGDVAYVTFHTLAAAAPGGSALHWELSDINEGAINSTACDGDVAVVVPQVAISMPDFCAAPGSSVRQALLANPANGLLSLDVTVEYDPLVVEPTNVEPTAFTAGFGLSFNVIVPGRLVISLYGTVPLAGSGPLVDITWHTLGTTGAGTLLHLAGGDVNEGALVTSWDDGVLTVAADADGDGFTTCNDCNDNDPNVHPGAPEICDALDNQCPGDPGYGQVDENVTETFYRDLDGDGYGDLAVTVQACAPPVGYVANSTDCNDNDASIHPGATEVVADGIDSNCDGFELCYVDGDHDGFGSTSTVLGVSLACGAVGESTNSTDCDDANAAVHPGATETCNGIDDNCNGAIDEGVKSTFHRDADGDGYGNALLTAEACSAPAGYVADATDCDDGNAAIHPGAPETCNEIDDNCNGAVDEGVTTTFHRDADADSFGSPLVTAQACTEPAGFVADASDCDDANAAVHPGAVEVCNGIDDDCNGAVDEGVQTTFWRDADADGFGDAAVPTLACTVPAGFATNALDCDDTRSSVHPGGVEVCNGIDDDCNGTIDDGNPGGGVRCGGSNVGECATGITACTGGSVQCAYEVTPRPETCDGRDNDCDGHVDNACSEPSCNVRLPLETKVGPNADLVVPIVVGDATGATGMTFEFSYDATRLTAVAVYRAALTSGFALDANLLTPGIVRISTYGTAPLAGGGTVAYVLFHTGASGFGGTPLHWDYADINEGAVSSTTCDGQVNVVLSERTFAVTDVCGAPGNTIVSAVTSPDASDVMSLDVTIEYDPAVLEPVNVTTTAFTAGFGLTFNAPQPGRLLVSMYGSAALSGPGAVFDVAWRVVGTAVVSSPIDLKLVEANEGALLVTADDGIFTGSPDADGDGYAACVDCNDADASIHPGAPEACDGKDNQCPGDPGYGQIDEGVQSTFHRDADGDGFGDVAVTTEACAPPSGYVSNATDCDDTNAAVHPGATEICNGIDDNCNAAIDEGVTSTFHRDADGDTFGDPLLTVTACTAPGGYVTDGSDCDDTNAAVHPGATEICNGIDDNCNAAIDEGVTTIFYRDEDGDGYGNPALTAAACTAPAGFVTDGTDCDDAHADAHPGGTEICDGLDNDCDGHVDNVAAPAGAPAVTATRTAGGGIALTWTAVAGATGYDVVRGFSGPVAGQGDFASAVDACLANDLVGTVLSDGTLPPAGEIYWYAVRAVNCGGNGTYDAIPMDQVRSRDPGIGASPVACP